MYLEIDEPQNYSAALYLRLSKEDLQKEDGDSESIKNQQSILEEYARQQNLIVNGIYIDDGITGTTFHRPNFDRMITDIKQKKINMVITKDMSRLGRDDIDTLHYIQRFFPENQVRYIALLDRIDTGSKDCNDDIIPFKAVINDMYAKDVSKKVTSTKRDKQRKGLFIGGKAPYGYKKSPSEKNRIIIDEPAAEIVRYIFSLALEGKSCREIAMTLNEQNILTPAQYAKLNLSVKGSYSGKWSSERISDMLKNEVYIGNMVQGRVEKASYKSKKCNKKPREEWIIVPNTHDPLIDRTTFEKVGLLIQSRSHTRSRTYDYLLKGITFCHECGHPLGVVNRKLANNRQTLYFICRTYQRFTKYHKCTCHCMRVEDVTNAVTEQVRTVCRQFLDKINLAELTDTANNLLNAEKKRQQKDVSELKRNLESVKSKIDKVYDDMLSGIIEIEICQRAMQKLKEEQASLESKIHILENSDERDISFSIERTKKLVTEFLNAKDYSKELLVSLIERIELTENKEILIYFRIRELEPNHLC